MHETRNTQHDTNDSISKCEGKKLNRKSLRDILKKIFEIEIYCKTHETTTSVCYKLQVRSLSTANCNYVHINLPIVVCIINLLNIERNICKKKKNFSQNSSINLKLNNPLRFHISHSLAKGLSEKRIKII